MKRIIMVVTIFIVLGIISITVFYFVKPSIFLYNNTNKIIYVYSSESTYGVEPNEKEVEEIIKMKPDVIDPGETLKLAPSILSLLKKISERIQVGVLGVDTHSIQLEGRTSIYAHQSLWSLFSIDYYQ